jgi:hypothetical protein
MTDDSRIPDDDPRTASEEYPGPRTDESGRRVHPDPANPGRPPTSAARDGQPAAGAATSPPAARREDVAAGAAVPPLDRPADPAAPPVDYPRLPHRDTRDGERSEGER